MVAAVERDEPHLLVVEADEPRPHARDHGRRVDERARRPARAPHAALAQLQRGGEAQRLGHADARVLRDGRGRRSREALEATVALQHPRGDERHGAAGEAGAEEDGEEVGVAERRDALLEGALARAREAQPGSGGGGEREVHAPWKHTAGRGRSRQIPGKSRWRGVAAPWRGGGPLRVVSARRQRPRALAAGSAAGEAGGPWDTAVTAGGGGIGGAGGGAGGGGDPQPAYATQAAEKEEEGARVRSHRPDGFRRRVGEVKQEARRISSLPRLQARLDCPAGPGWPSRSWPR